MKKVSGLHLTTSVPTSYGHLLELLHTDMYVNFGHSRSPYLFRGQTMDFLSTTSSLGRILPGSKDANRTVENSLLRNFRKYGHRLAAIPDRLWDWLSLAQHHGLPTRLMDWTISPLVALHFATDRSDHMSNDGVVWLIDCKHVQHDLLPRRLMRVREKLGSLLFTTEGLNEAADSLAEFDRLDQKRLFLTFFEPPTLDDRILNQFAAFSVLSRADASLEEWCAIHPGVARKILIPASMKPEIRDKLDLANITERMLYPGLGGLATWLKRYYSPGFHPAKAPPLAFARSQRVGQKRRP